MPSVKMRTRDRKHCSDVVGLQACFMSALSPLQLQETKDILAIPIYTRSAAKQAQTLKAGELQGLTRNRLSQQYGMKYCNRTLYDWDCDCDVWLWVVDWVFNIMNVWHWSRLEHDCITTYSQVSHKIEMCISGEYQGANIVNKINVQRVWINEQILGSYITSGNKKRTQLRFPWVIERNRGSCFYYLIGKKVHNFSVKVYKRKIHTGSKAGVGGNICANVENHSVRKCISHRNVVMNRSWNKKTYLHGMIFQILFLH